MVDFLLKNFDKVSIFVFQLVCCACIHTEATDVDQLSENQMIDSYYPSISLTDESHFVERASPRLGRAYPRLGRASPRLGRASPRLGRRTGDLLLSELSHAGRFYNADDDANNYQYDIDSSLQEKRASPRLGRAIN